MERVEVAVGRCGGVLSLEFTAHGQVEALRLPPPGAGRADELWRHTCFEAFVRAEGRGGQEGYVELNLSPSTRWAAYGFTGYRSGMTDVVIPSPDLRFDVAGDCCRMTAKTDLRGLVAEQGAWVLGLSAVLEDLNGGKSHWALEHPVATPDFHHPTAFALILPAQEIAP